MLISHLEITSVISRIWLADNKNTYIFDIRAHNAAVYEQYPLNNYGHFLNDLNFVILQLV